MISFFYIFNRYIDIIRIVANVFQIIYGINRLADVWLSFFDSRYRYSELINTIMVSISARKGLFKVKNKKLNIWLEK